MKKAIRYSTISVLLLFFSSCEPQEYEKLTVMHIEIFKDTPAWEFAKALEKSNLKKAKELLSDNVDLVNCQDPLFGTTLLMRAISSKNFKAVKFLLENGANPNLGSTTGSTPLFRAVSYSWQDILPNDDSRYVKILLEFGADPNIPFCAPEVEGATSPIECGTSPLMHATQRGFEKVKLLVEAGAEINYKTKSGSTAAKKALLHRKVDVAHYLIVENSAIVNEPYYYYSLFDKSKINVEEPHYPIDLLEDWIFDLGSEEHKLKMEIVEEFKRQGQDYWSIPKHPKTVERIKKSRPENWEEFLKKY